MNSDLDRHEPLAKGPRARRLRRLSALAASCLAALLLVYVLRPISRKTIPEAEQCPLSARLPKKLAPLAKGQVAAFQASSAPAPFPTVSFLGPSGRREGLAAFRGQTILMNLWATWCVPCRTEMPTLDALQRLRGGHGFSVVAIDVDTARLERRRAFLDKAGIRSLAFYADPSAQILRDLQESGPVVGLPTSFLIGPDGCKLGAFLGPANWASPDALALIDAAVSPPKRG